jgi:hypothetical protein
MDYLHLISWGLNVFLGVAGFFMKQTMDNNKDQLISIKVAMQKNTDDIVDIKVHYLHKDDFSEFKEELWHRLDDIKQSVAHNG